MPLTLHEVEHIARLARLHLTPEQKEHYRTQLSTILEHFARLQELDTRHIPPTIGAGLTEMPLREDQVQPSLPVDQLLSNAAESQDNQFKLPPVFD